MALTVADALRTWNTEGPLNAFLKGRAQASAEAQARDSSVRDWNRIAQTAVAQAKAEKAQDFNQMMDLLKVRNDREQFAQQQSLRERELGLRASNQNFDQSLVMRGINPHTGARIGAEFDSILPPSNYVSAGTGVTPVRGDSWAPPTASDFSGMEGGPDAGLFPALEESATVATPEGVVSDTITAAPGEGTLNVLTDMPSTPGSPMTTLVEGAPPSGSPGVSFGGSPELANYLSSLAKPSTEARQAPTFERVAEDILATQRATQSTLETRLGDLAAKAGEDKAVLDQSKAILTRRGVPDQVRQQWQEAGQNAAASAAASKTQAETVARELKAVQDQNQVLSQRTEKLAYIAPLGDVLPSTDVERITKSAITPKPSKELDTELRELAAYQDARAADDYTHKSKGVDTARAVGRAYDAMRTEKFLVSKQADEEARLVKDELDAVSKKLEAAESATAREVLTAQKTALTSQYGKLYGEGLIFRGLSKNYKEARDADVKGGPKVAASAAAAPPPPDASAAPVTAAPKPAPGKSLVTAWIEALRKTIPAPVAGPTGARPGIDFPMNRGY